MEFNCTFSQANSCYTCRISDALIKEKDHVIKEIKGVHLPGKSHKDVRYVWLVNSTVEFFPRGVEKHFPNLTRLIIFDCGIKEISRNDLKGLEGLVHLQIKNGELMSLPDDLFTEMPNLREVSFDNNKIEFASSKLLKPLLGRENVRVTLKKNKSIDALFWSGHIASQKSLKKLMKLIDEKCTKPIVVPDPGDLVPKIKEMWLSERFSDFTIIVGEKKFKAHKAILGIQSEVFAQIFEDHNEATEMKISEFSSNSVEALLKFIYTNEVSDGNAKENFEIADKFKVKAMKSFYGKIICNQLDEENAWETFLFAHRLSSQLIKEKAFQRIINEIPDEVPSEFMEDPENLKKLLDARRAYDEVLSKPKRMRLA